MDPNPHPNRRLALSKMDQNGITPESTPRLEQQDWCLRWRWWEWETRSTPPKASGSDGNGDGERHSTPFNPKPTDQAHSTRKQQETKEERAIGGSGGNDGDQRKLEEERLIRWEEERKSCVLERERELRVRYKEEREKIVKKIYTCYSTRAYLHGYCNNLHLYTSLHGLMWEFFCSYRVKWASFSILHNFTSTDVISLIMWTRLPCYATLNSNYHGWRDQL